MNRFTRVGPPRQCDGTRTMPTLRPVATSLGRRGAAPLLKSRQGSEDVGHIWIETSCCGRRRTAERSCVARYDESTLVGKQEREAMAQHRFDEQRLRIAHSNLWT